ncbi:MAG: hypothetical protein ABI295_03700 [Xanthomarina sp.]
MKKLLFMLSCLFFLNSYSQSNYIISVNNQSQEIYLDTNYEFKVAGKTIQISIKEKDTLVFHDAFYNFKHSKKYRVSMTELDAGIDQIMIMTAGGSGVIIQKYHSLDPSMLQEMMLNEVTKESISYGYSMDRKDYDKILISGEKLRILKAELQYKGDVGIYEISAFGQKDEGILILTMNLGGDGNHEGEDLINLMWGTLSIN